MELEKYNSIHGFLSNSSLIIALIIIILLSLLFSFIFPLIFVIKKRYFHCKCKVCRAYVTSSWSPKFSNLCDWHTHLLKTSLTKTIHIHVLNNIITANPENVEYMLKTNFDNYPKGKPFSIILVDLLGHGIFNVDGDAWQFQRKMASLELDRQSIRSFSFDLVRTEVDHRLMPYMAKKAAEGLILDFQQTFRVFSFSTICKFSFGVEIEQLQQAYASLQEFSASFDIASTLSAQRALEVCPFAWKVKRFLGVGAEKRLKEAIKNIDGLAMEVIRLRRNLRSTQQKDLLSRFMVIVKNDDKYLRDIIVKELQYLQAAIYESMRVYPPVQFDSKFSLRDDVLPDGTRVRKGTRVTYHSYAMARMEGIWGKDCLEFRPERWLNADGMFCHESAFKYPIFQGGYRVCLGKELAVVEMKCVILSILREFHVDLANPNSYDRGPLFSPGLTATYKDGLPTLLHRRKQLN
ncbi:hypothetical protein Cgig2_013501 [Carnegiea gigantea]|uniref:Cytochrome P450 n=1 Tax=Carnegiea gigantea TaxID=171969 RepID=A0A9Q1QAH0_9CARY|nr:hypothetical protein Cgig2_013501 [Carnegiea gigantea]